MDLITDTSFLTPTAKLKQLALLQYIEANPDTTQKQMAKVIGAAASMVNYYLDQYEEKKYIERKYLSPKQVKYKIRPEGIKRKNFLLITYLHELLKLYKLAEDHVENFLQEIESQGHIRVLLYGAGEVAETILAIIKKRDPGKLEVLAVIDDNKELQGNDILGFKIIARKEISSQDHDLLVLTSYAYEDEIMDKLIKISYPMDRVRRFFGQ